MRAFLLVCVLFLGFTSFAQDRCASFDYIETQKAVNPSEDASISNAEKFVQKITSSSSASARSGVPTIIKIPVVVHVIYKTAAENISDAQIFSQIEILNKDYRRTNSDTVNTPERFRSLAADVQVEFYLATADPRGRATSGIVRKQSNSTNWFNNDKIKYSAQGGDDAWDSKSYLNIWVGKLITGAGYSSVPGSDATKDGIVINATAFGLGDANSYYNSGRTATHEIGHWLGLKHIWGDAQCGDDGVSDTPPQSTFTQNCPTGFRTSCNNDDVGDMYMNFMDYTADACMNLFTEGQKRKMRAVFEENGPRESLLNSKGLREPWLEEAPLTLPATEVSLYPNPAKEELTVTFGAEHIGKTISVFSMNGMLVQTVQVRSVSQKLSLSTFKAGMYLLKGDGISKKFIKL